MKFTNEDYLKMFEEINDGSSISSTAKKYNIDYSHLWRKYGRFKKNGFDVFRNSKHINIPIEIKLDSIKKYYDGSTLDEIAKNLNIEESVVYNWVQKYQEKGYNGLINHSGRPRLDNMPNKEQTAAKTKELTIEEKLTLSEKENQKLRMENEALKKLYALVQQRKKRQSKKK